jgi:hypothetical protein
MVERSSYVLGVDLGQGQDHSATALLEAIEQHPEDVTCRVGRPDDERTGRREVRLTTSPQLRCHHVHRFPLDLPYPDLVQYLVDLITRVRQKGRVDVVIDNGGPGRVVGDMLVTRGIYPVRIAIVGTGEAHQTALDRLSVSQGELIHTTVKLSQQGILKLAPKLKGLAMIKDELQKFAVKVSLRGHETFGNFVPGSHDDLIFALSLACWYASSPWGLGDSGVTF